MVGDVFVYLCMVSDVKSNVLTVADVAVFDGRTRPLAAHTHSRAHWSRETTLPNIPHWRQTKQAKHRQNIQALLWTVCTLPVQVDLMIQWSMLGEQLTVISRQWWALWC